MMKPTSNLILAIDTSCDDTSAAVTSGVSVLSNIIASQVELHAPYGGVFPTVAKLAHREKIEPVIAEALTEVGVGWDQISAIAVTQGPGLAPALEVGIAKAQELAARYDKSLIAVNHIEGHALSPLAQPIAQPTTDDFAETQLDNKSPLPKVKNVLALVISGGHSEFILIKAIGDYQRLGWKIDDAAGEVLDKVGRLIGLGYPAGAAIEQCARDGNPKAFAFPLPMTTSGDFNLSFAGLKTFARNLYEEITAAGELSVTQKADFCASLQYGVFRAICYKLDKILKTHQVDEIWLGGGVAANQELRRMINEVIDTINAASQRLSDNDSELDYRPIPPLKVPYSLALCADNAAMIGVAAGFKYQAKEPVSDVADLERLPHWKIS